MADAEFDYFSISPALIEAPRADTRHHFGRHGADWISAYCRNREHYGCSQLDCTCLCHLYHLEFKKKRSQHEPPQPSAPPRLIKQRAPQLKLSEQRAIFRRLRAEQRRAEQCRVQQLNDEMFEL